MSYPYPYPHSNADDVGGGGHYYPQQAAPIHVVGQPYPYPAVPVPVHVPVQQHSMMTPQPPPHNQQQQVAVPPPAPVPAPLAPVQVPPQPPRPVQPPQQQPQRAGPIFVGGKTTTSSTANTTTTTAASTATSKTNSTSKTASNSNSTTSTSNSTKVHPIGRCVGDSLAILRAYASPSSPLSLPSYNNNNKRKTAQDHMNVLERLVPPLFLCTKNNTLEEQDEADLDDQKGGERDTKRIKSDTCDTSGGDERQEDVYSILAASTNTTSLSTTSKQEYHTQLKNQLANHIAENEKLLQRRQNVYQSLVRLHELYETGLDGIARMNDLTFVPDNVMPE